MKTVAYLLGALLIVVAVVYFVMPADTLPSFMPGHEDGMARIRLKHGIVAGAIGVLLFLIGWYMGRPRAA